MKVYILLVCRPM